MKKSTNERTYCHFRKVQEEDQEEVEQKSETKATV